jgi:transcriptional regulator with XRE-family HTH domain
LSSITAHSNPDSNNYTGIIITDMVRVPLTMAERERGERLGRLLREARGERSMVDVAVRAGISTETLRKIETGRIPTPAFFTVAALAYALELDLELLAGAVTGQKNVPHHGDPTIPNSRSAMGSASDLSTVSRPAVARADGVTSPR